MEIDWKIFIKAFIRLFETRFRYMEKKEKLSTNLLFFSLEPIYFPVTLIERSPVTHDTDWYIYSLPSNVSMSPPIGYHIRLKLIKDG